jgi:hypothetical protein
MATRVSFGTNERQYLMVSLVLVSDNFGDLSNQLAARWVLGTLLKSFMQNTKMVNIDNADISPDSRLACMWAVMYLSENMLDSLHTLLLVGLPEVLRGQDL